MLSSCAFIYLGAFLFLALSSTVGTLAEPCVVNRRLPAFGLGVRRTPVTDMPRAKDSGSRTRGGVCHMGRLLRVNNTLIADPMPGAEYSAQTCTHRNTTLTCSMLAQNKSHPADSKVHLHDFPAAQQPGGSIDTEKGHKRRTQCTSCARANLTQVLTRLLKTLPVSTTAPKQLSFGVPHRISTERLVVAHLHRNLCGANQTCDVLARALTAHSGEGNLCSGRQCLRRGVFMPSLLANVSVLERSLPPTEALWSRNWVFCPHNQKNNGGATQDASVDTGVCSGSIPKSVWLDPRRRTAACAQVLSADVPSSASINFCLMNAQTESLCSKMASWIQRTEQYLCQGVGLCDESDFFYSPTTFNLQEQEFVYDTVQRFYSEDAGLQCPARTRISVDNTQEQTEANDAALERCSSVLIAPLLLVAEQVRAGKRSLVLLTYHTMRVTWRVLEVFLAVTANAAAQIADTATTAVQSSVEGLLTEVTALMLVIGDFVEQIGNSVMELAMSKGVGSTFKEIILALCYVVEWIYNNIWAKITCPVIVFILDYVKICIDVWETIVNVLRTLRANVDMLMSFIEFVRTAVDVIASSLNECTPLSAEVCVLQQYVTGKASERGTLPMPTRCWSSYVTFFGDNQQLSCSAADTCKVGSLTSERVMCGACPIQTNPSIQEFACDYVTKICTCGVQQLRSSSCLVNEDCTSGDADASCLLINDNLETSRSAMLCNECQFKSMCFHSAIGDSGVCACGTRQQHFQLCTPQDAERQSALSLMLSNLCLYSSGTSSFYEVEFQQTSVIPCQLLDPTTSSCAYVVDSNMYIVRGFGRMRRRLLNAEGPTYTSMDPACRDALVSETLPNTRASCQAHFDSSSATLVLLGLDRQLPACALCSFADVIDATRSNPIAVLRVLSSATMLMTVVQRHGPAERASHLLFTLHSGITSAIQRILASDAAALVAILDENGVAQVHVDDTVVPPPIARALEGWIQEMIERDIATNATTASCRSNASACSNVQQHPRRLLFFQELVLAVEMRVRDGWDQVDRLHEAFAQSVTQILTYRHVAQETGLGEQQWGTKNQDTAEACDELRELLQISIRVTKGIRLGWLTLTHERDNLQRQPASTLGEAWPILQQPDPENDVVVDVDNNIDDKLVLLAADAVTTTLDALNVQPSIFYNFVFSMASFANTSFTCPYEAVQTCSAWRVRLWQGLIIVMLYFSVVALLVSAVGLSFISTLLVPIFSFVLLQLCYGYTWTCVPLVPVCAWQDFTESVNMLLPLTLELPDDLKKTDVVCLQRCANSSSMCLPRYPTANCTRSCKDSPFAYTSASSVFTWALAEIGPSATDYALNNSHNIPFIQHNRFNSELLSHISTLRRGSADFVRAHRLCAGLHAYMLLPYIVLFVLVVGFISTMLTLLTSQIFPVLLLVFSLFTAASAGPNQTVYVTEEENEDNTGFTQDNTEQALAPQGGEHVVRIE